MRQNRLLLLLALLMTVATGTWAQEPTKVTMAANDKTMGTVEVGGESKVEWTAETWSGWDSGQNTEMTKSDGGITMTYTNAANHTYDGRIREIENSHALEFFINEHIDDCTVTFSSDEDNISRIELSMTEEYSENTIPGTTYTYGNPHILPLDGWTFNGKSAVWEGEATKSLTLQSCSTTVSKITFFKGGVPDGVTVNGDGTFTVAKTATVKLTATPKEGYKFLYWEDDHSNTNPVREVTIEPGEADMTYTAVFAEITYNVTFADGIEDADKWSATPNTEVKKESKVDIKYTGAKKVLGVKAEKKAKVVSLIVNPVVGQIIGSDGKNYDANATLPDGVTKVAKICYVGSETGEAAPYNHGLALALSDANGGSGCPWKTENTDAGHTKQGSSTFTEESGLQYNDATHNSDTYPAFKAAIANNGTAAPTGCSSWFLASGYQWQKMIDAVGLANMGLTEYAYYWSSSENDPDHAWDFEYTQGDVWSNSSKSYDDLVRPCLAF